MRNYFTRLKSAFLRLDFRYRIIWAFATMVLLSITMEVFGRAGGGGGFSSGGGGGRRGGGGGGSRGGGGDGEAAEVLIRLLIYLIMHHPLIGIPLTIGIVVVFYKVPKEGRERYIDHTIRKGLPIQQQVSRIKATQAIQSRDPNFKEGAFLSRVQKAFMITQQAWSFQDLGKAQAFLSDGVFERFSLQLQEMKGDGVRDHMEKMDIREARIAQIQSDANFDTIHVAIAASAANYKVSLKDGKRIGGSAKKEDFEEIWSFLRRPGAQTLTKPGLVEGYCPNCSAPINIVRAAKCEVCGAYLRSGDHDWVLAEITQSCEWSVSESESIPGFSRMVSRDPGFNAQHLEDRSSVAFWRNALAERTGNTNMIRKFALESYCESLEKRIKPDETGTRHYFGSCAVGSVKTKGILTGTPLDKIFVEIAWAGCPMTVKPGQKPQAGCKPMLMRNIFVFVRKSGVKTSTEKSLASLSCGNCGAPQQTGVESVCEYCGTVQNDGSSDWVLERITSTTDREYVTARRDLKLQSITRVVQQPAATGGFGIPGMPPMTGSSRPAAPRPTLTSVAGGEVIRYMTLVMLADGIMDNKETALLSSFAKQCGVSESFVHETIASIQSHVATLDSFNPPEDNAAMLDILKKMASMALADGRLSDEELALLNKVGAKGGFSPCDIKQITRQERTRLFKEAKQALKEFSNLSH